MAMKLTVFGASGKVGRRLVAQALSRGHEVTAFVHHNNPFTQTDNLHLVSGDVTDSNSVYGAVQGSNAVISVLGSWHTPSKTVLTNGMKAIVPAMEALGIKRLITLTGSGAFYSQDRPTTTDKFGHWLFARVAPKILADGEAHLRLLEASQLAWTCIRSPVMTPGKQTNYKLKDNLPSLLASVSRDTVVQSLLDQLEDANHITKAPIVYRS